MAPLPSFPLIFPFLSFSCISHYSWSRKIVFSFFSLFFSFSFDPKVPVFDNLYLDMNGIVHQCTHGTDSDMEMTEEEMFAAIFAYIEMLFRIIKPCKVFYM